MKLRRLVVPAVLSVVVIGGPIAIGCGDNQLLRSTDGGVDDTRFDAAMVDATPDAMVGDAQLADTNAVDAASDASADAMAADAMPDTPA